MRYSSTTQLTVSDPAAFGGVQVRTLQAASAEVMESLLLELQDEFAALNEGAASWGLSFIDIAGGGDGHSFVFNTVWTNADEPGLDPINDGNPNRAALSHFRIFFWLASKSAALAAARAGAQQKIAARFDEPGQPATVEQIQMGLAGAEQGTRFMGFVITETSGPE